MGRKHFLEIAHERMAGDRNEHLWTPGSTAWAHYTPYSISESTIKKAKRDGYLSGETRFLCLTKKGYLKF